MRDEHMDTAPSRFFELEAITHGTRGGDEGTPASGDVITTASGDVITTDCYLFHTNTIPIGQY